MATLKKKKTLTKAKTKALIKAPAAKKVSVKKPTAKKVPPKKGPVSKTSVKKVVAKKSGAKKIIVKKTAHKKTVAKGAVVKKVAPRKPAAKKVSAKSITRVKEELGMPELMRDAALKVLDERQAEDIVLVSLTGRSAVADYMIIASGRAGRQIAAIADYLDEAFTKLGAKQIRVEGKAEANWVLIDAGDVIVHLFLPEVRSYYDLDSIWAKTSRA